MVIIENMHKRFNGKGILNGVDLSVTRGEAVALIGPSGSGKTTLIRAINGFVVPDSGKVSVAGKEVHFRNKELLRKMRKKIGIIYQLFNLVERASVLENVMAGALGRLDQGINLLSSTLGFFHKHEREKAMELLAFVGLEDKTYERVDRLSGGQKQRVAIARALMQEPELILADEPIANLDPKTSQTILDLLLRINRGKGITVITVLHHLDSVKDNFARVVALKDGLICFDGATSDLSHDRIHDIYKYERERGCILAA